MQVPFIADALYGLLMRLVFASQWIGAARWPGVMSVAFVVLVPIAVGAITVYVAEQRRRLSWGYYVTAPWLAVLLFIAGAAITLLEGAILEFYRLRSEQSMHSGDVASIRCSTGDQESAPSLPMNNVRSSTRQIGLAKGSRA
jgi:hypothetical protein